MKLGFIGLGKMGSRMSSKLILEGHDVIVWNRSPEPVESLKQEVSNSPHISMASSVEELIKSLESPKIVWSMLPSGDVTENTMREISKFVSAGDIVIDGANSHFTDTQRRFEMFREKGIKFLGIGVSGGIIAVKEGYPLMAGGDKSAYDYIKPLLDCLAKPSGGHEYFGEGGAGHFVKMVHNGIEYGMMQAIGEGFGVLDKSSYNLDLLSVAKLWQKGTIISSFLIDRAKDALEKDQKLTDIEGIIAATGEAEWTIQEAEKENVPVPVIKESLEFRKKSQTEAPIQNSFAAKMVAALRHEFGGHEVVKK